MKKKNLKTLKLKKNAVSNLQPNKLIGGAEVSERRTNCDYCPAPQPQEPVYSRNGAVSCQGILCFTYASVRVPC